MSRPSFDDNLAIGQWGEDLVFQGLRRTRFMIERTHELKAGAGRGPRIYGATDEIIPVDFRVCLDGIWIGLEVKTKTQISTGRITGKPEHGIDWPDWWNLREYEQRTRERVFLVIVEAWEEPPVILAAAVKTLRPRGDCPTYLFTGESMAYFTREQLSVDWLGMLTRHVMRRGWRSV
jgi:hypothetical protein